MLLSFHSLNISSGSKCVRYSWTNSTEERNKTRLSNIRGIITEKCCGREENEIEMKIVGKITSLNSLQSIWDFGETISSSNWFNWILFQRFIPHA